MITIQERLRKKRWYTHLNKNGTVIDTWGVEPMTNEAADIIDQQQATIKELVEVLEGWVTLHSKVTIETGCCCCGDAISDHNIGSNHSPVDEGAYYADQQAKRTRALIAKHKGVLTHEKSTDDCSGAS